jgi:hypothetical protein
MITLGFFQTRVLVSEKLDTVFSRTHMKQMIRPSRRATAAPSILAAREQAAASLRLAWATSSGINLKWNSVLV